MFVATKASCFGDRPLFMHQVGAEGKVVGYMTFQADLRLGISFFVL